jgi:hypothetical protein
VSAEENKAIMRRYFSVFEQGNIDLLDELLAPDYVNHTRMCPVKCVNRPVRFHICYPAINCGCSVSSSFRSSLARDPKLK